MSQSFKKFIFIITSLVLGHFTSWKLTEYMIPKNGDSFGGEAVIYYPIGLIIFIFAYYFLLKVVFGANSSSNIVH